MLVLVRFSHEHTEEVKKILSGLVTHRDGPGYRPLIRPTYYYPMNDINPDNNGLVTLIWDVGIGGKKDFYKAVINPLKSHRIPMIVEEFITKTDV